MPSIIVLTYLISGPSAWSTASPASLESHSNCKRSAGMKTSLNFWRKRKRVQSVSGQTASESRRLRTGRAHVTSRWPRSKKSSNTDSWSCMSLYSALSHQLAQRNLQHSTTELRHKTSEYMREHRDDFLPFLTHPDTGDALTDDEFEQYCDKTASTPVWGGQVELRALSEALRVPIEVLQAETEPMLIGDATQDKPLTVVYHRHIYRLGEHYNSVKATPPPSAEGRDEGDAHT
ncbi:OTU domain-containing protein 6B-like [Elysia marginata]|uniref:OTU domain-containing protein 6B-like n=1 Tax=Elysia marginata TaxID=1093978 RepID=A0AAV4FMP5_9GAST|nr:OTU domain-containing protein 6B-like [Elysia marginata]